MASIPSIKGSLLSELVEDVKKLSATAELPPSVVESRLTAEDLAVLEKPILAFQWYPIGFYVRCARLLRDSVGGGRNEYLRERGFQRGRKLIASGLYRQMEYASRTQVQKAMTPKDRFAAYGHDLKLFVTLSGWLVNFTEWTVQLDLDHSDRYVIVVQGADDYPDEAAWATEGLIDAMAADHGLKNLWRHERRGPSEIRFRMTRAL